MFSDVLIAGKIMTHFISLRSNGLLARVVEYQFWDTDFEFNYCFKVDIASLREIPGTLGSKLTIFPQLCETEVFETDL